MLDNSACQRTAASRRARALQQDWSRLAVGEVPCGAYSRQQQLDYFMLQAEDMQAVIAGCPAAYSGT